ncbi:PAS domain S-box protein [Roseiarcaceae bacterium H3SJ34-1]|uniref:PAS domain S-box protein n=1 Tax=Terripilifer ovatus TaxID=3032367 RepID=UPI003AB9746B|nr:PAS domain S-box protein [Roseiarcaceae bacterium H3SJ34-1]
MREGEARTDQSALSGGKGQSALGPRDKLTVEDVLQALPEAVYTTDASGRITFYNEAAVALWGLRPQLGTAEFCGSWKLYWPDGTPLPHGECSMALALREARPIRGQEAVAERPDGTRVSFLPFPTPIFDADGTLIGGVNMLIDLTERATLNEAAQRLAAIVESSDDAILSKDLNGRITSWNGGAERLFGYTAEEAIGNPVTMLIPLDRHGEETDILARIRRGERVDHYETIRRRKDGTLVEISLTISPVRGRDGRIIGASKIAQNITQRRRAEEQQYLLIREMDHRVKNLFALASGVVTLSARSSTTPRELAANVSARLGALAQAHALTVPRTSLASTRTEQTTTLHELLRTILAPYGGGPGETSRTTVTGPDIPVAGSAVTSFALLLHEFATNAAKYGALSTPDGHVDISCEERDGRFILVWSESGGPAVERTSDGEGFGTLLGRATVKGQLDGEITRDWRPEGLSIRLVVARSRLSAEP